LEQTNGVDTSNFIQLSKYRSVGMVKALIKLGKRQGTTFDIYNPEA